MYNLKKNHILSNPAENLKIRRFIKLSDNNKHIL